MGELLLHLPHLLRLADLNVDINIALDLSYTIHENISELKERIKCLPLPLLNLECKDCCT